MIPDSVSSSFPDSVSSSFSVHETSTFSARDMSESEAQDATIIHRSEDDALLSASNLSNLDSTLCEDISLCPLDLKKVFI